MKAQERNKKGSILVVDDQPNNLKMISEVLSDEYKIVVANSGQKALKILDKMIPDLILSDVLMPEMNGFELCKKIKSDTKTKEIPIIFLTAKNSTDDIVEGFSVGAVDYIITPFHSSEVLARVGNHIQLKRAKEELKRANSKLETLNKEKDKFFSIISHDLKNPFSAIIGLSRILVEQMESDHEESIKKDKVLPPIKLICQSGEATYKLLENLLTWSRSQTGKIELKQSIIPLRSLLIHTIDLCQSSATNKNITIINEMNEDVLLFADMNMIDTVLRNLITNAIKFTHKDGTITIRTDKKDHVTISIIDTGIGMSQDTIDKLFDLGAKIATKGTEKENGTGIGLLICKEFVERNGGKLSVESKVGKGSNFSFTLNKASLKPI